MDTVSCQMLKERIPKNIDSTVDGESEDQVINFHLGKQIDTASLSFADVYPIRTSCMHAHMGLNQVVSTSSSLCLTSIVNQIEIYEKSGFSLNVFLSNKKVSII